MKVKRLERAYQTFIRCHDVVSSATSEAQLLRDICHIAVHDLGYKLAWVGLTSPDDRLVRPAAQAGYEAGYLTSIKITWEDDAHGQGPTGRAIRLRKPQIARDIATDERFVPWRADALARGYASSAALPLLDGPRCLGAFNLYATEPNAFNDDEIALLEEMALDLVLGQTRLRAALSLAHDAGRTEAISTAVASIAHDLNNLLQIAALSIQVASSSEDPLLRTETLRDAVQSTTAASALVRQLMSLSRRGIEHQQHSCVDEIVQSSSTLLARLAPNVKLEIEAAAGAARVQVASLDLLRILINLVVNAGHAMKRPGRVLIRTEICRVGVTEILCSDRYLPAGTYVCLSVIDEGEGIAPEHMPRIFESFFTTKSEHGTGLGLPVVLSLARGAGGDVAVESQLGVGTRFKIYLPVLALHHERRLPQMAAI